MQILFLCVKQSTHFYRDQNCNWQILTTRCGHYRWTLPTYVASNHPDEASLVLGLGPQQASGSWHPVLCAHPLVGGTHRSPRKVLVPPFYVEGNWGLQTVACPRAEMLSPEGETSGSRNSLSPTRFLIPIPGGRGLHSTPPTKFQLASCQPSLLRAPWLPPSTAANAVFSSLSLLSFLSLLAHQPSLQEAIVCMNKRWPFSQRGDAPNQPLGQQSPSTLSFTFPKNPSSWNCNMIE